MLLDLANRCFILAQNSAADTAAAEVNPLPTQMDRLQGTNATGSTDIQETDRFEVRIFSQPYRKAADTTSRSTDQHRNTPTMDHDSFTWFPKLPQRSVPLSGI